MNIKLLICLRFTPRVFSLHGHTVAPKITKLEIQQQLTNTDPMALVSSNSEIVCKIAILRVKRRRSGHWTIRTSK